MSELDTKQDDGITKEEVPSEEAIRIQLQKILNSSAFQASQRLTGFLRFIVEETLAGRDQRIKARTIAIKVLERTPEEQPQNDPIVRVLANRLRRTLKEYYSQKGVGDPVHIGVPKGAYIPTFHYREAHITNSIKSLTKGKTNAVIPTMELPRVAVLPFFNLTSSQEQEFFADGLGEELSAQLARFQGLAVLAYWSTSQFRGEALDVLEVGQKLRADYLVTGSVATSSDRMRVNVQCQQAKSGEQLWTQRFDRRLTVGNLFDLQDEIVEHVVACIGDNYGAVPQTMFRQTLGKRVEDLTAYEAILLNHHYVRRLDTATHNRTRAALERAVHIDPDYALAWGMLSAIYCDIRAYGLSKLDGAVDRAEQCAQRAVTLDPNCQHAHYAMTYVGVLRKDHGKIVQACDNMVELNPNAAFMIGSAAVGLGIALQFQRALPLFERSIDLNPYYPGWFQLLPWLRSMIDCDYDLALQPARCVNMPTWFWDPLMRATCLSKLGRVSEAAVAYQELVSLQPDFLNRPEHYIEVFVHSPEVLQDIMNGLREVGMH